MRTFREFVLKLVGEGLWLPDRRPVPGRSRINTTPWTDAQRRRLAPKFPARPSAIRPFPPRLPPPGR